MTIGEKIRDLRREHRMTQEELAEKVGTRKQTIFKYETGIVTNIPASKIKALADALDTTPAYLMDWEESPSSFSRRLKEALQLRGWKAADLSKKTGIEKSAISYYLSGKYKAKSDNLHLIATALGVSDTWLMGFDDTMEPQKAVPLTPPTITTDTITFPVIGEVAAGYDGMAMEDWTGDTVEIPASYIAGNREDYFVLNVHGDSMYPLYHDQDKVLVKKQSSLAQSGDIGVVLYEDEMATLKKVEYVQGEDWMRLIPLNMNYGPKMIEGEDLEHCRILGVPKLLIRKVD